MRTAAIWSLIPRRNCWSAGGGRGNWPDDRSGIRFRAAARTRQPPPVPVSPTILPGHGSAHAAGHMHQEGISPHGRSRRPPPAWRPQSMVRLPGVMAPSRELPVGVGGDARDTRCGPPTMCSMQTHRWPDGRQLSEPA
jgi:hypothetical protein